MRLATLFLLAIAASPAVAQDTREQIIEADCEFSADLEVKKDWKLIIKSGVTLKFAPGVGIICRGILDARGTASKPVKFIARDPERGWANVAMLAPGTDGSTLDNCRFSNGRGRLARFNADHEFKDFAKPEDAKGAAFAVMAGGALFICGDARVEIRNCRFEDNAAEWGGAVAAWNKAKVQIVKCDFRVNRAREDAGAVHCVACDPFIDQCIFAANFAKYGGAIHCLRGASPAIEKSWFGLNGAGSTGGAISCYDRGCPVVQDCWIDRNNASKDGGSIGAVGNSKVLLRMNHIGTNRDATGERKGLWMSGEELAGRPDTSQIIEETQGAKPDVEKLLENAGVLKRLKSIPEAKDLK
ncbi:MAG: right-handed parallel beta-helix repeat-containing protein [Planctomycetota bacterium]